jgi:hypothetical protein
MRPPRHITKNDLDEFRGDFGKGCARKARPARRLYSKEFGKAPEDFTVEDLRRLARPNRYARTVLGSLWKALTEAERRRLEGLHPAAFEAYGDILDEKRFLKARLARILGGKRAVYGLSKG